MSNSGLICLGLTTLDVVALPIDALPADEGTTLVERIVIVPAGTAGGAAMVAAALGLETRLATALGGDLAGRVVRLALEDQGVDLAFIETLPDLPTSTTILAVNSQGGRPNFHAMGAGFFAGPSDAIAEAAGQTRFLHYAGVGGPRLDGGPGAQLLETAKAAGATVTCDLISPQPGALDELRRLLPYVDYFLPSAAEAVMLSGRDDLADAALLHRLRRGELHHQGRRSRRRRLAGRGGDHGSFLRNHAGRYDQLRRRLLRGFHRRAGQGL